MAELILNYRGSQKHCVRYPAPVFPRPRCAVTRQLITGVFELVLNWLLVTLVSKPEDLLTYTPPS